MGTYIYSLVVLDNNVLQGFEHSGNLLHSMVVAETEPGTKNEQQWTKASEEAKKGNKGF